MKLRKKWPATIDNHFPIISNKDPYTNHWHPVLTENGIVHNNNNKYFYSHFSMNNNDKSASYWSDTPAGDSCKLKMGQTPIAPTFLFQASISPILFVLVAKNFKYLT